MVGTEFVFVVGVSSAKTGLVVELVAEIVTEPVTPGFGVSKIVYALAVGSGFPSMLSVLVPLVDANTLPVGGEVIAIVKLPPPNPAAWALTIWPAVPVKVTRTFCPVAVVVRVTAGPSGVRVAVTSVASTRLTFADPVALPEGTTNAVYVPVAGRTTDPNVPDVPMQPFEPSVVPVGLRIETVKLQEPKVPPDVVRVTPLPCVPSNTNKPIFEAVVSATGVAAPPIVA
jgi:hypothetical protein